MELNELAIHSAAESALANLQRTSFSGEGFTSQQADAIANAITSAIIAYDEQLRNRS